MQRKFVMSRDLHTTDNEILQLIRRLTSVDGFEKKKLK